MEHNTEVLSRKTGIDDPHKLNVLLAYAELIYHENQKYNLTGNKTLMEIIDNLIIGSLNPVLEMNVPHGTLFADLGTGAGIPGIPLAVKYPDISGVLFDSNRKKIDFIERVKVNLEIRNIRTSAVRIEESGRLSEFREKFDLVVTRAMSDLYTIAELSSPLLKTGGYLYVYTNIKHNGVSDNISDHITRLGLTIVNDQHGISMFTMSYAEGILIKKIKRTEEVYPRRMAVIKRMAVKNER